MEVVAVLFRGRHLPLCKCRQAEFLRALYFARDGAGKAWQVGPCARCQRYVVLPVAQRTAAMRRQWEHIVLVVQHEFEGV